jgi:hypothetical protein
LKKEVIDKSRLGSRNERIEEIGKKKDVEL